MLSFLALIAMSITLCALPHGSARAEEKPKEDPALKASDDAFKIIPDPSGRAYFPKGKESYYTCFLAAMKEPSLMPQQVTANAFALRFTWLRSFHEPIAIRIWREGNEYRIRGVRLAKQPDLGPGPISHDKTRKLTKDEFEKIQRIIEGTDFWKSLNDFEIFMMSGNDGAGWIFERLNQQDYSVLDLWSPRFVDKEIEKNKKNTQLFDNLGIDVTKIRKFKEYDHLGLYLLKITKLLPDEKDIY